MATDCLRKNPSPSSQQTPVPSSVLLVKVDGPVWYNIYLSSFTHCSKGKQTPLSINQPLGKGHLFPLPFRRYVCIYIYIVILDIRICICI